LDLLMRIREEEDRGSDDASKPPLRRPANDRPLLSTPGMYGPQREAKSRIELHWPDSLVR
jgi:hypothetical protein